MRLDPDILADLTVAFEPSAYLRGMPLAHRKTPLGTGGGHSRFSDPEEIFKVVYVAEDLETCLAECLIRDRFENRRRRRITMAEVETWGVVEVSAKTPLRLIDIRTTGLLRLGVSTDAGRAKRQTAGRRLSHSLHGQTGVAGLLYRSRLTNGLCCAIFDRAVAQLEAGPVVEISTLAALVPALQALNVEVIA